MRGKGSERNKRRESCEASGKRKSNLHVSQESKVQKEARFSHESLTVKNKGWKTNKDTHAKNQMWKGRRRRMGRKRDSWERSVITPGPYRWLWLIAPQHHATPIKSITHGTRQPLHSLMQLLLYAAPFPWALLPLILHCQKPCRTPQAFLLWTSNWIAGFFKYGSADVFRKPPTNAAICTWNC